MKHRLSDSRFVDKRILGAIAVLLLLALVVVAYIAWEQRELWLPAVERIRLAGVDLLSRVHPLVFFLVLATLPVLPVPISPFYLTAGIYPLHIAIPGLIIALSINMALAYWLADSLLKPLAELVLRRTPYRVPQVTEKNAFLVTVLIRVSGIPFSGQNYLCPIAGVPFSSYMKASLPIQLTFAFAFMLLGESLMQGKGAYALTALAGIAFLGISFKLLKHYLEKRRNLQQPAHDDTRSAGIDGSRAD